MRTCHQGCQYAKDVGMPQYKCKDRCQYGFMEETVWFLLSVIIGLALAFAIVQVLTLPVVEFDTYGKCVKVQNPAPSQNCANLPKKYRSIRVSRP